MILVSPAERAPELLALGQVSAVPERFGADFMWLGKTCGKWGVQRKEVKDLLASVADGRLAREVGMWPKLDSAILIVEGRLRFDAAGVLMTGGRGGNGYGRTWRFEEVNGLLLSMSQKAIVAHTENIAETARFIAHTERWSRKAGHKGIAAREPLTSVWGRPTNREFGVYLLSGLPGVGVELAGRIMDHYGRVPWRWEVGVDDLCKVEGIGKKKAEKMIAALGVKEGLDGWD